MKALRNLEVDHQRHDSLAKLIVFVDVVLVNDKLAHRRIYRSYCLVQLVYLPRLVFHLNKALRIDFADTDHTINFYLLYLFNLVHETVEAVKSSVSGFLKF